MRTAIVLGPSPIPTRTRTRATTIATKADVKLSTSSRLSSANLLAASSNQTLPYQLDKNAILTDLTSERPQWILSAYGPGRFAPAQLFGGLPREQSFEEMRLLHYMGLAAGNPQQVVCWSMRRGSFNTELP